MAKVIPTVVAPKPFIVKIDCAKKRKQKKSWSRCMCQQLCAKIKKMDEARKNQSFGWIDDASEDPLYNSTKTTFVNNFMKKVEAEPPQDVKNDFIHPCAHCEYKRNPRPKRPTQGGKKARFNADHMHEASWGGDLADLGNLKMMNRRVNMSVKFPKDKVEKDQPIEANLTCNCPDGPAPDDPGDPSCSQAK